MVLVCSVAARAFSRGTTAPPIDFQGGEGGLSNSPLLWAKTVTVNFHLQAFATKMSGRDNWIVRLYARGMQAVRGIRLLGGLLGISVMT